MIANQLIKQIKAHRGPIVVEVSNFDDTFYVQAVKADLLLQLSKFQDDEESGFELDAEGFLSKDYTVAPR
jgi:hypothetical protein